MIQKAKVEFREYFVHRKLLTALHDKPLNFDKMTKLDQHYVDWKQLIPFSSPVKHQTSLADMSPAEKELACVKDSVYELLSFHICRSCLLLF